MGTGAPPALHGIISNFVANSDRTALREVFQGPTGGVDPTWCKLPTLSDWWDERFGNRAVMLTQVFADYAAMAIGGHGKSKPDADRDVVVWYDSKTGHPTTDERWFRIPSYVAKRSVEGILARHGSSFCPPERRDDPPPGKVRPLSDILTTPWYARWEAEAMLEMMIREQVGRDEVPDLVQINLKVTDAFGHRYGHENRGFSACLREIDRFLGAAEVLLRRRAGEGRYLVVVTADHGLPPDDAVPRYLEDLTLWLGRSLDRSGDRDGRSAVVGIDGYQVILDPVELAEEGVDLPKVRELLLTDPHVIRAWTAPEVRQRAHDLGLVKSSSQ
jgi:predicted AlkP superfamily pyrophosphatase or phosphodiesterase